MKKLPNIEKVAIANRGEVAVRIIRACQELNLATVLLHSEADAGTMAYRMADERVCVGPAEVGASYLNIESNIQSALSAGADAVHPGFGFLSENADFAQACEDNGLVFVGPSPESIRLFGDKISAKNLVRSAGGPVIPGYEGEDQSVSNLQNKADEIGYPVIVKVAGGGGGRGLRVIRRREEAQEMIASAKREGISAFGSDKIFLEKFLDRAKHIEVQIFGDASGRIHHLFERECSVQRRHQKILEEAPSAALDGELRNKILHAAVSIAQRANYRGAGTVEFLVQDGKFYFMEMNTRLQVEHPVSELVAGKDLVKAQLLTAMGRALFWDGAPSLHGHSIECRIYAENPYAGGVPSTGRLGGCHFPQGPGRRFEIGFEEGDEITSHYDSMIAKVVVWDETRPRAIEKMKRTLRDTVIFGVHTNIPLLLKILGHHEFVDASMTTGFFAQHFAGALEQEELSKFEQELVNRLQGAIGDTAAGVDRQAPSPWSFSWGPR